MVANMVGKGVVKLSLIGDQGVATRSYWPITYYLPQAKKTMLKAARVAERPS